MPDANRSLLGRVRDRLPDAVGDKLELGRELARHEKDRLTWASRGVGPRKPVGRLLFWPELPTQWHAIWKLSAAAGYRITNDPSKDVDAVVRFIDTTWWEPDQTLQDLARTHQVVNLNCSDIAKSTISRANLEAFGRQLGVDPLTYDGVIVVKSEANATHDGVLVQGPIDEVDPEMSYQRLVDNRLPDSELFEVLRTPIIDGDVPVIYRKLRSSDNRLDNSYDDVTVHSPDEYYSGEELDGIRAFARQVNMEYGEIDVLRDLAGDGQIYVVDANNTPWGPPRHMREDLRIQAVTTMTPVFRRMIERRAGVEA